MRGATLVPRRRKRLSGTHSDREIVDDRRFGLPAIVRNPD